MIGVETGILFQALNQTFSEMKRQREMRRKSQEEAFVAYDEAATAKAQEFFDLVKKNEITLARAESMILGIQNLVFQQMVLHRFELLINEDWLTNPEYQEIRLAGLLSELDSSIKFK